jgi:hypothetical protein
MQVKLDLSGSEVKTGFTVLPSGIYDMKIASSEVKETKAGGSYYLELSLEVMTGEHSGKMITDRLNIKNANKDTQKWALNNLKTILTMGGHKNPNYLEDTDEMIGLMVKVSVEEEATTYTKDGEQKEGKQNNIKGYFKIDSEKKSEPAPSQEPVNQQVAAPPQAEKTAAAGAFPWS